MSPSWDRRSSVSVSVVPPRRSCRVWSRQSASRNSISSTRGCLSTPRTSVGDGFSSRSLVFRKTFLLHRVRGLLSFGLLPAYSSAWTTRAARRSLLLPECSCDHRNQVHRTSCVQRHHRRRRNRKSRNPPSNSGLQRTRPAGFLPSRLCHHRVAGRAAEPRSVGRLIQRARYLLPRVSYRARDPRRYSGGASLIATAGGNGSAINAGATLSRAVAAVERQLRWTANEA